MKANKKVIKTENKKTENNEEINKSSTLIRQYYTPNLKHFAKLKKKHRYLPFEIYASIFKSLHSQYSIKTNDYIKLQLENLLESKNTHKVAIFKDYMIMDYKDEFLKREYAIKESLDRIPKFVNYYKNYLRFFCKPTFCDFDINVIIQTHGEKCAEMYYNKNYAQEDKKKKKKKKLPNEDLKVIFSLTVKNNISNNSMNENSVSVNGAKELKNKSKRKENNNNNKGNGKEDNKDSTLQFTNLDISIGNNKGIGKGSGSNGKVNGNYLMNIINNGVNDYDNTIDNDSIVSMVNKIKAKDTITIPTSHNSLKETRNMTERISSGNRGSLKTIIDTKYLLPNTLYKLKSTNYNPPTHIKNTFSNQFLPSSNTNNNNKLNLDLTPIIQKGKKDINYIKISVEAKSKQKTETTRNFTSALPQTYSNDIVRTSAGGHIFSTTTNINNDNDKTSNNININSNINSNTNTNNSNKNNNKNHNIIQHSNSNLNQQNAMMISSMIYSHQSNNNNYLTKELCGRKTMTNIQIKNVKSNSKNNIPSTRSRNPLSEGLQMLTMNMNKPIFSSFNYFDKQQQLLNINKRSSGDCLASSTSKGTSSIIKKKNSRFNSDPFKTTDKLTAPKGKIKLGIASNNMNKNHNNNNIAGIPLTKRTTNLPIESLIKLCRDKPIMKLGKNHKY